MTNVTETIQSLVELAAKSDWRVAAGIAAAGLLAGVGCRIVKRIRARRETERILESENARVGD